MASEFLLKKWRKEFQKLDINRDNLVTVEDADIFSGNFSRYHNFDTERAEKAKADCRTYWREWNLRGLEKVDEDTYLANMEKAYLKDKDQFRKDARRLFSLIMDVVDVNKDKLVSEDEFIIMVKSTGFENYDEKYMKCYPQEKPGYISLDVYLDAYVEFYCNEDINNIGVEKPRHFGQGIIDV